MESVHFAIKHAQLVLVLQQLALLAIQALRNECFQEHNVYVFPDSTMSTIQEPQVQHALLAIIVVSLAVIILLMDV